MGRPCKVCSSSITEEIDKQILDDISFSTIEKYCIARGLTVSAKSIGVHAKNHVKDYKPRATQGYNYTPSDTPRNQTAIETALNPLLIKQVSFTNNARLIENAKRGLSEILLNQIAIVSTKQKVFMEGQGGYPNDEMRGLKTIVECFQVITGTEKNKRAGHHIFDVDSALEVTEGVDLDELLDDTTS